MNENGKNVAVIGGRDFDDVELLSRVLHRNIDKIKIIVSGGADGADSLAVEWAKKYGIPFLVFPAKWRDPDTGVYDKGAGFKRNWDIVRSSDVVIAFYDGESGGTGHSISIAKQLTKPLHIVSYPVKPKIKKVSKSQEEVALEPERGQSVLDERQAEGLLDFDQQAQAYQKDFLEQANESIPVSDIPRETL